MRQTIRLRERELRNIIAESVKRILHESIDEEPIKLEWDSHYDDWTIPVDYKCEIYSDGYVVSTTSLYDHRERITFYLGVPMFDENGKLNEFEIEEFVEDKWDEFNSSLQY